MSAFELNYNKDGFNLICLKAFEGNRDRVWELISAGACPYDAVYGAAFGGRHDLVDEILVKHPDLRTAAAHGYARADNESKLAEMKDDSLKLSIATGHAEAGKETQVRAALNAIDGKKNYLPQVFCALAVAGQSKLLLELIEGTRFYPQALRAAAKAGRSELVRALLAQISIDLDKLDLKPGSSAKEQIHFALKGYSEGRHFPEVVELLHKGASPSLCLEALAPLGVLDKDDATVLINSAKKYEAVAEKLVKLMRDVYGLDPDTIESRSIPMPPDLSRESSSFGLSKG